MSQEIRKYICSRIETACESLRQGMFFIDARGRILSTNTAFCKLLGYSKDEAETMSFLDLSSPACASLDAARRQYHENFSLNYLTLSKDNPLPLSLIKRDGHRLSVELESVIVPDDDGDPLLAAIFLNVYGNDNNTESASAVQQHWEIGQQHYGVIIADFSSLILKVNNLLADMLGYGSGDDLLGRYLLDLGPLHGAHTSTTGEQITIDEDYYQSQVECIGRLYQTGRSSSLIYMFRRDGLVVPVEVALSLLTGSDGSHRGTMAICRDITDQLKAEKQALADKAFLENVFATATDGVYVTDDLGSIVMVNNAFCEMSGYSREELLGKYSADMLPDKPDHFFSEQELELQGLYDDFSCVETVWQRKDGATLSVEVRLAVLRNDVGGENGLVAVVRDVTRQKCRADALRRAQQELEQMVDERTACMQAMDKAMELMMQQVDDERKSLDRKIAENFDCLVLPYIERMKSSCTSHRQRAALAVIEINLKNIADSFSPRTEVYNISLTPAEIQIANLIRQGLCTKEIAEIMGLSARTIEHRRNSVRKKLGITDRKISLSAYLHSAF